MKQSKWRAFQKSDDYEIIDLGRPAVFLVPIGKLQVKVGKATVEKYLEKFLKKNFEAFTVRHSGIRGHWKGQIDDLTEYEVSFLGKEKIPKLLKMLADLSEKIGEKCFYIKAGQYTALVSEKWVEGAWWLKIKLED
ncbi:hypothetical protein A3G55_04280 [Candidatus Giovannonibacteria bacterium RIFCSPLOWO2_12_FULL_44_25]|uniref:Uncharacterized protein n=3 Tax=Parcubacteria group TaxID=1794811 RepID=A0A837IKR3_9BACT|nr:MAG: hypothetical protein UW15_C0002G0022 [Parcubacteria group bacterium GW2011_GWC1_44_10]KKT59937.1 MAG: hypothetical protein UW53_C0005G0020 [Candidatus Giovannonibacteria bacterium GW2011_GWA1_44_25]KKU12919.1 MAG: hypothetical protein UX18_C0006G0003 [Candidatus Azambacteria bacterium GW2011_GWC2_45_7b]KKU29748.1 MAG: hypothetical protein UX43_C0006G0023 [Candidatus Giovannonibacteria bacterium GW2011_GWB1_46_20]OGF49146.1 MAG: hypothetical protein A2120_01660 [Candidatus Giovannonibact